MDDSYDSNFYKYKVVHSEKASPPLLSQPPSSPSPESMIIPHIFFHVYFYANAKKDRYLNFYFF